MKTMNPMTRRAPAAAAEESPLGLIWFVIALLGAGLFFSEGIETLLWAWTTPEYSHGPLIPLLSGLLFLRHLKTVPPQPAPVADRWPGVAALLLALALSLLGKLAHIGDIVAYGLIVWIGGIVLVGFGWRRGWQFWPSVLHLVFMLPLPGLFYYKVSTTLQMISSELGVWVLQAIGTPVFLDGNIIDLGIYKLHVAEACSGLRYLFPIMSFSYVFAALYRGPTWHKAVLLLAAVPLAVVMNSLRIALVGVLVDNYGIDQAEGLAHLMEGWVVFLSCIVILFGLAWLMLRLQPAPRMSLPDALDLDLSRVVPQLGRLRRIQSSSAMIAAATITIGAAAAWHLTPARPMPEIDRPPLIEFPRQIDSWQAGLPKHLDARVEAVLGADDYLSLNYQRLGNAGDVDLFVAWYEDQTKGGIHSPEVCLPGSGWEMSTIETVELSAALGTQDSFQVNRAVLRKGTNQLLVYYWFDQGGRRITSDYWAKVMLLWTGITQGRTDGALVRLITPLQPGETDEAADARLQDFLRSAIKPLPLYVAGR